MASPVKRQRSYLSVLNKNSVLRFDQLFDNSYVNSSTLMGCVVNCYPIQPSNAFGKYRKVLLKELVPDGTLGDRILSCFLYGKYVDRTREMRKGDVLIVKGFEVKPNNNCEKDRDSYPYQLDVISTATTEPEVTLSEKKVFRFLDLEMISKPYSGVCIVGRVISSHGTKKTDTRDSIRRLMLKDELPDGTLGKMPMECILYDNYASQNKHLKAGDTMKLTGFHVEARPSTSTNQDCFRYQVVFDPEKEEDKYLKPSIVVVHCAPKKSPVKAESQNKLQSSADYQYTCLKDLKMDMKGGQGKKKHFNFYGIVVQCVILHHNINESLKLVLRDPTLDSFVVFIRIRADTDIIPDICPYDIVRFHRVYLEQYRTGYQGICYSTKDLVIFSGKDPATAPIHTSRSFSWTNGDREKLESLRKWSKSAFPLSKVSAQPVKMCQQNVQETKTSNLSPKKVPLQPVYLISSSPKQVASVGVQTPPSVSRTSLNHLPDVVQSSFSNNLSPTKTGLPKQRTEKSNSPATRTFIPKNISLLETPKKFGATEITSDSETPDFIPPTPVNSFHGSVSKGLQIKKRRLDFEENVAKKKKRTVSISDQKSNEIEQHAVADGESVLQDQTISVCTSSPKGYLLSKERTRRLYLVSVPNCDNIQPVIPMRDLKDAKLFSRSRVRAMVLAVAPDPSRVQHAIHYCCNHCQFVRGKNSTSKLTFITINGEKLFVCPNCDNAHKKGRILKKCFVFAFRLDDGSAIVNAYLYHRSAEYFFGGVSPNNPDDLSKIRKGLEKVLSLSKSRNNPPVLDCYFFKYSVADGHAFQIVDTKLI